MPSDTYKHAIDYLARGWSAIPLCPPDHAGVSGDHEKTCKSPGKAPYWPWKLYQTEAPKPAHLTLLWKRLPAANVGLVMGPVSGLIGLDLDEDGQAILLDLASGELPNTLEFTTPGHSGGRRYLFKHPSQELKIKSIPGKDGSEGLRILATGSQTVAPPSIHSGGGKYEWVTGHGPGEIEPQECPAWLINLDKVITNNPKPAIETPTDPKTRAAAYLAKCDPAISGQGGHNQTFKVVCKVIKGFCIDPAVALDLLLDIYNPRCVPPWTKAELEHKIQDALTAPGEAGFLLNQPKPNGNGNGHHHAPAPDPAQAVIRSYTTIQKKAVEWLWYRWVPLGKITILDGDPGLGKSTMLLDLAARVSTDGKMPDGSQGPVGKVVVMSAEDGAEDIIKPRIEAAGAKLDSIIDLTSIQHMGEERPIEIPRDFPLIESTIKNADARLLIVDPLMAFLCGPDANKDQEIRRVLYKLSKIAEKHRCAVVCLRHLNKGNGQKAIYRGNSSIGVIGHARSGILVAEDPDDDTRRVAAITKCNYTAKPEALQFVLQPVGEVCKIGWCGTTAYKADDLVAPKQTEEQQAEKMEAASKTNLAKQLLQEYLSTGPKPVKDCKKQCQDAGLSTRTIERAATKLGLLLQIETDEYGGNKYLWGLPGGVADPQEPLAE